MKCASIGVCIAAFAASGGMAKGAYSIGVVGVQGQNDLGWFVSRNVAPGQSFTAAVVLFSDDGSRSDSAVFRMKVSRGGLLFASHFYDWKQPYVTGGVDDFSIPQFGASGILDASTFEDPIDPVAIDLHFENLTPHPSLKFTTGVLLTATFTVPATAIQGSSYRFSIDSPTFTNGSSIINTEIMGEFEAIVVPSPAVSIGWLTMAGAGGLLRGPRTRSQRLPASKG